MEPSEARQAIWFLKGVRFEKDSNRPPTDEPLSVALVDITNVVRHVLVLPADWNDILGLTLPVRWRLGRLRRWWYAAVRRAEVGRTDPVITCEALIECPFGPTRVPEAAAVHHVGARFLDRPRGFEAGLLRGRGLAVRPLGTHRTSGRLVTLSGAPRLRPARPTRCKCCRRSTDWHASGRNRTRVRDRVGTFRSSQDSARVLAILIA
jgi:hypothetical protein